jgi:hypothetical protein
VDQEDSFTSQVKRAGINPYVDVPEQAVKGLGGGAKAAVLVKKDARGKGNEQFHVPRKNRKLDKDATRLKTIGRLAPGDWFRTTLVPREILTYLNFLKTPEALEQNVQKVIAKLLEDY